MNLRFKQIDIENFRSIARAVVDLENQGTVIVKGINEYEDKATSNGSGKSSVFEAIIFALFEETSSGEKDVANRIINDGYTIILEFEIDGVDYKIQRQCKANKTSVVLYKNGLDISARNKTDTNKLIIQILGISKAIFLDSIFLSQNANTNLASLTPTARKERLEILTNTDFVISQFKERLKDLQNEYEAKCVDVQLERNKLEGTKQANLKQQNELQFKIQEIEQEIERLKQLGDLKEIEQEIKYKEEVDLQDLENLYNKLGEFIVEKENEITELRKAGEDNLNKKDDLEKQKQEKLNNWNELEREIQVKSGMIANINQNNLKLDKEIEKIRNSDTCPTCGRKYEDANEEHIQQAISDLENEKINNDEQVKQININIEQLKQEQSKIEIIGKELANEILQVSALIEEHKKQVDNKDTDRKELVEKKQKVEFDKNKCQREINELKNKKEQLLKSQTNNIDEFKTMINKLNDEIGNIDSRLTELDQEYNKNNDYVSVIKNSIQMVTKEFRTYLLQNSLQYLNKLLKDYSSNLFSNNQDIIKIEEDDTKLNIKLGNATYESLSGGEKTRVNIALLLAQKSLASIIGNISCNIIILDEILGYCDSQAEENVINLLTQELETLESIYMVSHKEIPIGYDTQLVIIKDKSGLSRVVGR